MNKGILRFSILCFLCSCSVKSGMESPKIEKADIPISDKKICLLLADLEEGILLKVGSESCIQTAPAMYLFQPILALAALESGGLKDPQGFFPWDKTKFPYIRWQKEQNLKSALENSTLWYFEKLWMDTGAIKVRIWLDKVGLPSAIPTDPNRTFWMDGGYVWTADEFFSFLWKFFNQELDIRQKNRNSVLEGLARNPGEIKNPSGSHTLEGNWGSAKEFYSDSGTGYGGGRSVSWYWFSWKKKKGSFLFLSRVESQSETLSPLEAAKFGISYLREKGLWEKYFSE